MRPSARSALASLLLSALFAAAARAHEAPVATGVLVASGQPAVLRTTRGLVFAAPDDGQWRLQCLEYSGILETHTPDFALSRDRVYVATVNGLLVFDRAGCLVDRLARFDATAVFDVWSQPDGSLSLVTGQAQVLNDGWVSSDGNEWQPLGLDLSTTLLNRLRPFDGGWLGSGIAVDIATGTLVHGLIRRRDGEAQGFVPVETDDDVYRVFLVDVAPDGRRALVLVDRFEESVAPDVLLEFDGESTRAVVEAPLLADARYDGDGAIWAATADGLLHVTPTGTDRYLQGTRIRGIDLTDDRVRVTAAYGFDGFALAEWGGEAATILLEFDDIAAPTECADAPAACAADWSDWQAEVASAFSDAPADPDAGASDTGVDAGPEVVPDDADSGPVSDRATANGASCASAQSSAAPAALFLLSLFSRRRRQSSRR